MMHEFWVVGVEFLKREVCSPGVVSFWHAVTLSYRVLAGVLWLSTDWSLAWARVVEVQEERRGVSWAPYNIPYNCRKT